LLLLQIQLKPDAGWPRDSITQQVVEDQMECGHLVVCVDGVMRDFSKKPVSTLSEAQADHEI